MNFINGLLLVDKPKGCTSHDVVAKARRILGLRGIGHAGTLDPLASGLLVLLLGEGTKVSDFVLNGDKAYEVKVQLGVRTDTLDLDGTVLTQVPVTVTPEEVRAAAGRLSGALQLPVPLYSAVKIGGKKLYDYARQDQAIVAPLREMTFSNVQVLEVTGDFVRVAMSCTKGSFIRAWAAKLGDDLGCGGAVAELRRTRSEPFSVDHAISLEQIEELWKNRSARDAKIIGPAFVPLRDSLPTFRTIFIQGYDEVLLKNGQIPRTLQGQLLTFISPQGEAPHVKVISKTTEDLLSILTAEPGQFYKIRRSFQIV